MSIKSYDNICSFYVHNADLFVFKLYYVIRGEEPWIFGKNVTVNPLLTNVPILHPLERAENLCFSQFLKGGINGYISQK